MFTYFRNMSSEQKNWGVQLYIAALTTVLTIAFGFCTFLLTNIYNRQQADIEHNELEITSVKSNIRTIELGQATTNAVVEGHSRQIKGLYDLFGTTPTFRRRME